MLVKLLFLFQFSMTVNENRSGDVWPVVAWIVSLFLSTEPQQQQYRQRQQRLRRHTFKRAPKRAGSFAPKSILKSRRWFKFKWKSRHVKWNNSVQVIRVLKREPISKTAVKMNIIDMKGSFKKK